MNNNYQNSVRPILTAVFGGMAVGALAAYLSDDKHRKSINAWYQGLVDEGKDNKDDFRNGLEKTVKKGRKVLAKKIRQVESRVAQS